jgi:hypothetical protein
MSYKTTYILFGLAVLLLGGFLVTLWYGNPTTPETSEYVLQSVRNKANPLKQEDVDRVEVERNRPEKDQVKIVFVKDPETKQWKITEPRNYRADRWAVEDLVRQVYDARKDPTADKLTKLSEVGLDPPAGVITLKQGDRAVSLNLGDTSPGKENAVVYCTSSDDPREIVAVKKSSLDSAFKPLNDFRDRDLLAPSSADVRGVALAEGKKGVELKKSADEDLWVYVKPPYGRAESTGGAATPPGPGKSPDNVGTLLTDLTELKVEKPEDFVADGVTDLARYNLDPAKGDVLRVAVDRTEEVSGEPGRKERKTTHRVLLVGVGKKVDKADQYYACLEDDRNVVKIAAAKVEPLRKLVDDPGALRDRNLVDTSGLKKPDAIDVVNGPVKMEFRKAPGGVGDWKFYRGDETKPVDETAVRNLVDLLTEKNVIQRFVNDPKERERLGVGKPDVTVSVWLDGVSEEKPKEGEKEKERKEPKPKLKEPDKPSVVLRFGHLEEGLVAVERKFAGESEGVVALVPAKVLDQVRKGPLAYLDRKVPSFGAISEVTRVVIDHKGATTEVAREKPGADWKIVKPQPQAGRTADRNAVEDVLSGLDNLHAERVVAEKVDATRMAADYGLSPPASKVVLTLTRDGKPQTFEYHLGKDAGGHSVFLKAGSSDTVYAVSDVVLTSLGKELQDLAVFHFDPSRAKELKLTGWKDQVGAPAVLLFKRKDNGDWAMDDKSTVKYEPDQEKVRKLLDELSRLRAERFVAHNAKPTPEQGLDVAQNALRAEVVVEGEKAPLVLTVGNADGDKGYFATSSTLPGDVFDVRKEPFEAVRGKTAYFRK